MDVISQVRQRTAGNAERERVFRAFLLPSFRVTVRGWRDLHRRRGIMRIDLDSNGKAQEARGVERAEAT